MSTVIYDLDTSGGLMDQIQALIAPPPPNGDSKDANKQDTKEHPYFRRPGKGHNHDYCDACGEGGDLICCDKCPASFHLQCHDPPLQWDDIPSGEWLCHCCTQAKAQNSQQPLRKRLPSTQPEDGPKVKMSPMDILIQVANAMNPKQFELPKNMLLPCNFPGTDKDLSDSKKNPKLKVQENGNGIVPLPAKKCYNCGKTCRAGPLISCDYCSAYFHLDCLDPPLTIAPSTKWMCPLHVEHILDSHLLTSISLTERVKLWDKFGSQSSVDQDIVKLEFFRKIHRKNPPFRFKLKLPQKNRVKIPEMVKSHYDKPVSLLPRLRDVLRVLTVEEKYGSQNYNKYRHGENIIEDLLYSNSLKEKNCNSNDVCDPNKSADKLELINGNNRQEEEEKLPGTVDISCLDDRTIKLLAYQQIRSIINSKPVSSCNSDNILRKIRLPSEILSSSDVERIRKIFTKTDQNSEQGKPQQQQHQTHNDNFLKARAVLCPVVSDHFYNIRNTNVDPAKFRLDDSFNGFRPTLSTRFPDAVPMRLKVFNIGQGSHNDLDLDKFGECNFVSPKHAVLFYDQFTNTFELLNYSQYGTCVNNVLYSVDGKSVAARNTTTDNSVSLEKKIREIIEKRRKKQKQEETVIHEKPRGRIIKRTTKQSNLCLCNPNDRKVGWEGPAILFHGTLLKFGCLPFVFSVVD